MGQSVTYPIKKIFRSMYKISLRMHTVTKINLVAFSPYAQIFMWCCVGLRGIKYLTSFLCLYRATFENLLNE